MCMGGVDKTAMTPPTVSPMMLQTARLVIHDPPRPCASTKTPPELWEAAIETTKIVGGLPTFENDDVIVPPS